MSVTDIIFADMVPLPERGKFQGIAAATWALASAVGPPIGGALASTGKWRWLFFINLPLCAVATVFICFFFHSHVPTSSFKSKLLSMDWSGNALIILSTVLVLLGLTWGGIRFPWASPQVLVPVIIGVLGIVLFFVAERLWLKGPTIPDVFFTNRTVLSGYLGTFFHGVVSLSAIYYVPVYLQASKDVSALHAGIDSFGLSFTIPAFAIFTGLSVEIFNKYRPQNYIGWMFTVLGFGLFTMLGPKSPAKMYIGFQIPLGIGLGILWISTQFPILAPLPFSNSAYALAFWVFVRNFANSWGVVAGGAILQNVLAHRLPQSYLVTLPRAREFAYAIIPQIRRLPEPLKGQVREAFADGTRLVWWVMFGMSVAGLATCLLMREEEMKTSMDETWALQETAKAKAKAKANVVRPADIEADAYPDEGGGELPQGTRVEWQKLRAEV
ncbi:MFS general substrate transporter [Ganoderma sinense ZZ0214-1]|uniref:MFS general substrate transporter n=1 Tax=Ganoderma sinense ZZ0214-1 TaxID=1077348 RepID=A0A2G8RXW4_9APHY|nr:MFS general substrate transporter [Ganoderma sinense ZZ0214-1]